ncbi:MAG: hypothetical protein H6668_01205 [Ardenticatenaceae bacterium]|nr:hypothetical protein [Ardenticatenaceae bacterium]
MTTASIIVSKRVTKIFDKTRRFTTTERLVLAKLLLDSLVDDEQGAEEDWHKMSLAAFEKEWDNPDDAVYDNWREVYGIPAR